MHAENSMKVRLSAAILTKLYKRTVTKYDLNEYSTLILRQLRFIVILKVESRMKFSLRKEFYLLCSQEV